MRTLGVKSAKIHPGTDIETANQSYEPGIMTYQINVNPCWLHF